MWIKLSGNGAAVNLDNIAHIRVTEPEQGRYVVRFDSYGDAEYRFPVTDYEAGVALVNSIVLAASDRNHPPVILFKDGSIRTIPPGWGDEGPLDGDDLEDLRKRNFF